MTVRGCLSVLAALSATAASAQNAGGVPRSLLTKFRTGVNITRWFCYLGNAADTEHYDHYLLDADYRALKDLNVSWVRLCVSPEAIYDHGQPNQSTLPHLDAALRQLEKAGLAISFDLHDNGQLKLDQPGHDNSGFVSFWQAIARHYKGKSENRLVFELLNEPQFTKNPEVWYALQRRTVAAIRAIDSHRTIMVTSTSWSGIDTMAAMEPLHERNLLYTFHCYDPFFFTHQGATWVGSPPRDLKHVPFPSSPDAVAAVLDEQPASERSNMIWYGAQRFDANYLAGRVGKAMTWGSEYHVPVVLGEFGAFPPVSPVESRTRWFEAMRTITRDIPNGVWGYDDGLGLGRTASADGSIRLDAVTLKALYGK
jgi:aryl-phospho-beta-D-glucosidase BglC (GH1 family)